MKTTHCTVCVFIIFLAVFTSPVLCLSVHAAEDEDTIVWLKANFPPYYILEGPHANQGIADNIERLLKSELSAYRHVSEIGNWSRILKEMKSGRNAVCLTFLKKPEREAYIEFSTLTSVKPTNGISVRRADPSHDGIFNISFKTFLARSNVKIGVMQGRAYGLEIDPLLENHQAGAEIVVRSSADGVQGLLNMLVRGRIDAALGYPHEAMLIARNQGYDHKIKSLRIMEQPPLNYSYSGAPKTAWGKKVISEINRIYEKHNILKKTSLELVPYLDAETAAWFLIEVDKLIEDNRID